MPSTGIEFRPDIQGLRAIAVALVVLAHAEIYGFAGGFVGVDVFFVLSGYLITGLLVSERLSTGTMRYGQFLARRLRRLLPAMLVMLVLVLLVSSVLLTAFEMRMQSRSFPFAAAWISNFFFAFAKRDYFLALQEQDLFLHTWSLGVEEQFYLIWPWLVVLFIALASRNVKQNSLRNTMLGAFAIIFVASLVLSLFLSASQPTLSFYMMPARGWQFALGSAVFAWLHITRSGQPRPTSPILAGLSGVAGLALILGSAMLLGPNINYPGPYALFPSFGAAMTIAAGRLSTDSSLVRILSSRPLVWTGDRSYSIYLWHWPVFVLSNALGVSTSTIGIVVLVTITILLADACYRYIEYPFWKGRFKTAAPLPVASYASLAIITTVLLSLVLEHHVYGSQAEAISAQDYDPRQDASPAIYARGKHCDTGYLSTQVVPCPIGNKDGDYLAIMWGDSIGTQWSPMISEVFPGPDWQVLVLTKSACAIVDKTWHYEKAGGDYVVCTEWRDKVLDYINMIEPDVVIIGSSAFYDFDEADWIDGSARILGRLHASVDRVVVIPGTPRLSFDGPSCLEDPWRFSFRRTDDDCGERRTESLPDEVAGHLRHAAQEFANVDVLELSDLVCPGGRCAAANAGGIAVYRDKNHLTASFVKSIVPAVQARIESLGIEP